MRTQKELHAVWSLIRVGALVSRARWGNEMKLGYGAIAMAIAASGCATITRGSHEAFTVNTDPSGAHVTLSTGVVCDSTPCTFAHLERKAGFGVTVTKPGFKTWTGSVTHQTAGGGAAGMAGNVLVGGIIGLAVDANSGATQELVPNPLSVKLEPEMAAVAASAPVPTSPIVSAAAATTPSVPLPPKTSTPAAIPVSAPAIVASPPATTPVVKAEPTKKPQ